MVTAAQVKELREKTSAGMMDCKKALEATDGDMQKAAEWLRENGIAKAAKKGDRVAAEGLTRVVANGNKALLLELNSETDFVAKNEQFLEILENVSNAILNSDAQNVEEALKVELNGGTVEDVIVSGTATIGEKLTLRRISVITKNDDEVFGTYMHNGGKISAVTVIKNGDEVVAKQIAMHVAAAKPAYLDESQIDAENLEKELEIVRIETIAELRQKAYDKAYKEAAKQTEDAEERKRLSEEASMNDEVVLANLDKILPGKKNKHLEEICLVNNKSIFDSKMTIAQFAGDATIVNFGCYEVGEGIEKKEENFAEEVAKASQVN